nr:uncharacterized protein LOC109433065 [Aedes albopictus]XP_029715435.1 uncharacterized protein LOC109433065 [Aedes albopictus]
MADALKLADMQRASVEFERQRHLANWLIESSPHMPKPTPQQQKQLQQQLGKKGKFKQNPMFFLAKIGHNMNIASSNNPPPLGTNLISSNSIASTFNSQTNLPLAIVSSSGRDGHKPKLRRFNSHDTSANMFSVAEFENARLARRNEIESAALLRQRQRYKLNSLSSGGDCSTGESKGSKLSSESTSEPLLAEQFLEKFSLPRVVRLSYTSDGASGSSSGDQTMTSSSSAESTSTSERKKKKKSAGSSPLNGELFLLYRLMRSFKIYHVFNTKSGNNRKKGYKIPQDYPGYFSFLNEKGTQTAVVYTTIVQLVRERVYKFLSLENISAYTESHDNFNHKTHYVKATAKAGQVYRLLAVFQDGDHKSASSQKDTASVSGNAGSAEKERGKYAQLLGDNRQIYYVSLSAKGKFYEIEQHTAPVLQKSSSLGHPNSSSKAPKQLNRECVHRIGFIMQSEVNMPLNLKLIASMNASNGSAQNSVPEYITIAKISNENFIVTCPLDEQDLTSSLILTKLHLTPQMKFTKCSLGFDNEQRMFLNGNVQTVLKFCQFNCDNFTRVVDNDTNWVELQQMINAVQQQQQQQSSNSLNHLSISFNGSGSGPKSEVLKRLKLTRLFGSSDRGQNSSSGHEKEDSIIFFSKNDLENLECGQPPEQRHEPEQQPMSLASGMSDKMKVFTPSKKKWFKGFRSHEGSGQETTIDEQDKKQASIDRYQDMSRLIQERFGEIDISGTIVSRANSDIGFDDGISGNPGETSGGSGLQKCLSLQHIDLKGGSSSMDIRNKEKPDLVNHLNMLERNNSEEILSDSEDTIFFPIRSSAKQQSFMTEKLYSEFHVKTKQHSKSHSSIQHLLNLASPQRLSDSKNKSKANDKKRSEIILSFEDLQSLNREEEPAESSHRTQWSLLDDLPYSNVRDSIVMQEPERRTPSESIYAEICAADSPGASPSVSPQKQPPVFPAAQHAPPRPEKRFTSIRINVPSSDSSCQIVSHNPAGNRCASNVASPVEDNIYNTIK